MTEPRIPIPIQESLCIIAIECKKIELEMSKRGHEPADLASGVGTIAAYVDDTLNGEKEEIVWA